MRPLVVVRYVGLILLILVGFMLVAGGVSCIGGPDQSTIPLFFSALIGLIIGIFPVIFSKGVPSITRREGYAIVVIAWLMACIVGGLPYLLYGDDFNIINSFFESVSGFTTTGASIINDIEALPDGLLFWRMSISWIGGIGVVMFALLILPSMRGVGNTLSDMELSTIAKDNYNTTKRSSIIRLLIITYCVLTTIATVSLRFAGMDWFDAICHAMSACSTCGFSTKNASIAAFHSPVIESIIIVAMTCAGIHFGVFLSAITGRGSVRGFSSSLKVYISFMIIVAILASLSLWYHNVYSTLLGCMRRGFFHVVSLTTTTGFAITDTNTWPAFCVVLLTICSLICACSGSTTGGIKIDRMVILAKSVQRRILRQRNPNRFYNVRIDGKSISDDRVEDALNFIAVYILIVAVGCVLFTAFGNDLQTSFSGAVACMGNVGPGFGIVGSVNNYSSLNAATKFVGVLLMLLGRLEIFEILQLFYNHRKE
ncbi:MAG: TrkH family potassium uptake protein [Bacteroidales bacterium]|nr:TrkH family potassium uptake protein [Bacteroidales bacterium]